MTKNLFESYMQMIHAQDYHGTDDDMPDNFENWITNIDDGEMMEYAESFSNALCNKITERVLKYSTPLPEWNGMTAHELVRNINFN